MKKQWFGVLIIFTFFLSMTFAAQTQPQSQTGRLDPFVDIIKDYYAAWNSGDLDKAAAYYTKKPNHVFYDVTPLKYADWSEYRAGVEKIFIEQYTNVHLEPNNDLDIHRAGPVVWTTLTFHLSGLGKDGKKLDLECRHTAIWQKEAGKWVVVHEHVSTPLASQ